MISTINNCIKIKSKCPFKYETMKDFENDLLKYINLSIIDMVKNNVISENIKTILIAIDGVPTMAKMGEQKLRRYMGNLIGYLSQTKSTTSFSWSKKNISPGTNFMKNLQESLRSKELYLAIKKMCINLDELIISDTTSPGEGEMKIINFIKQRNIDNADNIIVYSPDSDVILLLMMLDNNLTMLRYDQQSSKLDNNFNGRIFNIININKFSEVIISHIINRLKYIKFYRRNLLNDIIFMFTIFGDDFLPKLETFRVNYDIFILLDYYIVNYIQSGYLLEKINNEFSLRTNSFLNLLKLLLKQELLFLKRNSLQHIYFNYNKIEKDIVGTEMFKFRELFTEYLWKFIYLNKKTNNCGSSITPNNITKCYNLYQFDQFINKDEPKIDNKILEKFAKRKFLNMNTNILKKLKEIFNNNYLYIVKYLKNKVLFDFIIKNKLIKDRIGIFKNYMEMYYLIDTKDNLFRDFIFIIFNTFELPLNITLIPQHQALKKTIYSSSDSYHSMKLRKLNEKDKIMYKIDYKLDEYFKIFNPKDEFYYKYFNTTYPNREEIKNYYKINFGDESIQNIINEYLLGLNWVLNYYFNNIIDKTWLYPYGKTPFIFDIINNYNPNILKLQRKDKYSDKNFMTTLEQIIFISPINLNKDIESQIQFLNEILPNEDIKKIVRFILENKNYFFYLDKIYSKLKDQKLIDCSGSVFVSKCHLVFLEKEIILDDFLINFRKFLPLEYQRKFYPIKNIL